MTFTFFQNVLMETSVHESFDRLLELRFEPTLGIHNPGRWKETPHTYSLGFSHPGYKTRIEFTIPEPVKLLLPSPECPQICAACAKAARTWHIERMFVLNLKLEDVCVLSKDGASTEALKYALLPLELGNPLRNVGLCFCYDRGS